MSGPGKAACKLVTIGEASEVLGVSISTLRRWDKTGKLKSKKTASGYRLYDISKLKPNATKRQTADINAMLQGLDYGEIRIVVQDGKVMFYEVTTKHKK